MRLTSVKVVILEDIAVNDQLDKASWNKHVGPERTERNDAIGK